MFIFLKSVFFFSSSCFYYYNNVKNHKLDSYTNIKGNFKREV